MTPLPKSIVLAARTYSVAKDAAYLQREAALLSDAQDGLYGHTNNAVMEIVLDPTAGPIRMKETLLHELLHAVLDVAGLDELLGADNDEQVALRAAPLLLDLLRRNRALVAFLTE